jgi:hypothetical protein
MPEPDRGAVVIAADSRTHHGQVGAKPRGETKDLAGGLTLAYRRASPDVFAPGVPEKPAEAIHHAL